MPSDESADMPPESTSSEARTPLSGQERRRWPRAKADWPISVDLPEGRFEARVRDISAAGVCFFLDRPLEAMTRLAIELELPIESGSHLMRAEGVVVRSEKISEFLDHYEIAVFTPGLSEKDKDAVANYVSDHPGMGGSGGN
jgi:hypothetical protein